MKDMIRAMMVVSALAGALALNAQTPQPAPAPTPSPTPAPQAAPAPEAAQAATPTAEEIVARHLDAIGGKQAIGQVKSVSMDTDVQVMGNDAPGTTVILDGVGVKSETDFNGSKIIQCYTSKGGWMVNPMAGQADPTPMPDEQYQAGKDDIYVGGALYNYADRGAKVELVSKDADSYTVKLTPKDGEPTTYVIDAKTYFIKSETRKAQMQGQDVDMTTSYSDYRKTDTGFLMPYTMDVDFGGQFQLTISVKKLEVNKTIDPSIFEMPKAGS
jgi:hypothetical protein